MSPTRLILKFLASVILLHLPISQFHGFSNNDYQDQNDIFNIKLTEYKLYENLEEKCQNSKKICKNLKENCKNSEKNCRNFENNICVGDLQNPFGGNIFLGNDPAVRIIDCRK